MFIKLVIFPTIAFVHLTGAAYSKESSPLCSRILAAVSEPNEEELVSALHDLIEILPVTTLQDMQEQLKVGEIGVILLLFVIGIEFPFAKIRSIGKVAVGVGTLGLISTMGVIFYASLF